MPDSTIIEYCSPTLAGIKTGNMFTVQLELNRISDELAAINRRIIGYGLRLVLLRYHEGRALLYLYRPSRLKEDLRCPEAAELLSDMGYPPEDSDRCVALVARRIRTEEEFPHEIGLFLSYPPEDVRGFMDHPSLGVKRVGCWKVYGNEEEAEKTFQRYQTCTDGFRYASECGVKLENLIAAER